MPKKKGGYSNAPVPAPVGLPVPCKLWDVFCNDIVSLSNVADRGCVQAIDIILAFDKGMKQKLENCQLCRDRAQRWLAQFLEKRRPKLEEVFSGRDRKSVV